MKAVLDRITKYNPEFNAFCTLAADKAMQQAVKAEERVMSGEILGPLHGIPVSIKDLVSTIGLRTTLGSKIHENMVLLENDIVVDRLEAAGAIVAGKTNTCEFGWAGITDNRLFGIDLDANLRKVADATLAEAEEKLAA